MKEWTDHFTEAEAIKLSWEREHITETEMGPASVLQKTVAEAAAS